MKASNLRRAENIDFANSAYQGFFNKENSADNNNFNGQEYYETFSGDGMFTEIPTTSDVFQAPQQYELYEQPVDCRNQFPMNTSQVYYTPYMFHGIKHFSPCYAMNGQSYYCPHHYRNCFNFMHCNHLCCHRFNNSFQKSQMDLYMNKSTCDKNTQEDFNGSARQFYNGAREKHFNSELRFGLTKDESKNVKHPKKTSEHDFGFSQKNSSDFPKKPEAVKKVSSNPIGDFETNPTPPPSKSKTNLDSKFASINKESIQVEKFLKDLEAFQNKNQFFIGSFLKTDDHPFDDENQNSEIKTVEKDQDIKLRTRSFHQDPTAIIKESVDPMKNSEECEIRASNQCRDTSNESSWDYEDSSVPNEKFRTLGSPVSSCLNTKLQDLHPPASMQGILEFDVPASSVTESLSSESLALKNRNSAPSILKCHNSELHIPAFRAQKPQTPEPLFQEQNEEPKFEDDPKEFIADNFKYVKCPYCGRKFFEDPAKRHIPICENVSLYKEKHNLEKAKRERINK